MEIELRFRLEVVLPAPTHQAVSFWTSRFTTSSFFSIGPLLRHCLGGSAYMAAVLTIQGLLEIKNTHRA